MNVSVSYNLSSEDLRIIAWLDDVDDIKELTESQCKSVLADCIDSAMESLHWHWQYQQTTNEEE
jgi:hypothetical protein